MVYWIDVTSSPHNAAPAAIRNDGVMNNGSAILQSASSPFTAGAAEANKIIRVEGAGPGGGPLVTTIFSWQNNNQVTLNAAAQANVTGAQFAWGRDAKTDIQSAVDEASSNQLFGFQPVNGRAVATLPTVFFPRGIFLLSGAVTAGPYIQLLSYANAVLYCLDDEENIFEFNPLHTLIRGLTLLGGARQLAFENANLDETVIEIFDCEFQLSHDYAIYTKNTISGDEHMSANLTVRKCRFTKPRKVLYNTCDSAVIADSWIYVDRDNFDSSSAAIRNVTGLLRLDNFFGVPVMGDSFAVNGDVQSGSLNTLRFDSPGVAGIRQGDEVIIPGAGSSGADLRTTVSAVVSATQFTLATSASTAVTDVTVGFGVVSPRTITPSASTTQGSADIVFGSAPTPAPVAGDFLRVTKTINNVEVLLAYGSVVSIAGSTYTLSVTAASTQSGATATIVNRARLPRVRWIDNYAKGPSPTSSPGGVICRNARFGGEDGGLPILYNFAGVNNAYPYIGTVIDIAASQLACGPSAIPESAVINIKDDGSGDPQMPQLVRIEGCYYPISAPYFAYLDDTVSSLETFLNALNASAQIKLVLEPNMTFDVAALLAPLAKYVRFPYAGARGLTLANGANRNITLGNIDHQRISGPTQAFSVESLAGGVDGREVTLLNASSQQMTITHWDASSPAANRIACRNGANVVLAGQWGSVTLRYDGIDALWYVKSFN